MLKKILLGGLLIAVASTNLSADEWKFAKPEMILDGSAYLYPSPVFEDLDNDGKPELLIGDLRGNLTIHKYTGDGTKHSFGEPVRMQAEGENISLPNW
ncbi:MAG: hypothetical protein ACI9G1_005955 [Pirellulaceae bacterium]|jgi:hypothetical protein